VVGVAQVAASGLLIPLLWLVWPYRLQTLDMNSPWPWLLAWTLTDFVYYWIHRLLHATRVGWALHAPHHSIRQLSLLDSLRTSWGEQPVGVIAYGVPLVLLGVPPWIAGGFYLFVALYQFAVHTEMDWSLGPLDAAIYTPAAHRSHHATTWAECDRNYGGFFLLFDRIFGTWTPTTRHDRPPRYGVPGPQPQGLRAVLFGEMERLWARLRETRGVGPRLRLLLGRPATDALADE
jgi:sterol desaturase/sphingolipid hydroxylase (fatty acid hydroxylase superfamily)